MFSADYKSLDLPNIYKIEKETYFFFIITSKGFES